MENILTLLPATVLLILSVMILKMLYYLITIYNENREPIIFHGTFIVLQLFLAFFTGSIGLFFELDQINHPLFQFNVLFLSMTYIGYGFIIHEIFRNKYPILVNYNLILLGYASGFALVLILGGNFYPPVALLSQFLPLVSLIYFDYAILNRLSEAMQVLKSDEEKDIGQLFRRVFLISMIIHCLGIFAMVLFSILFLSGSTVDIEQIWVGDWSYFDLVYFIALNALLILFYRMMKGLNQISHTMKSTRLDKIINEIIT